jgi:thiamine biosynthesis lipoprotein
VVWKEIATSAFLLTWAAGQPLQRFEAAEPHMGSVTRITIYARDDSAIPAAFARIKELDEKLSDYKPDSELKRVCRTAHERPVRVSDDLFRVLEAAQHISRDTDGAFDVTIGPVTHLWRQRKLPTPEAMRRVGFRNLVLDPKERTVFLKLAGMQLDLGGIAKGFAADEALAVLQSRGVSIALVAVSGDLAIGDPPPGKEGWTIKLEPADRQLTLRNVAVSTSGDSEQSIEINGVHYSHIIDPQTGLGLTSHIAATVIAPRGLLADPLATAVSVLGKTKGTAYAHRRGATLMWGGPPGPQPAPSSAR